MPMSYDHLSKETQTAIGVFKLYMNEQFYTERMTLVEATTVAAIPDEEFAEFVRITTAIQNSREEE